MIEKEHNDRAQELLSVSKITDSSPLPWKFVWTGVEPPMIYDANGKCVAVLSTGTLLGADPTDEIIANAKRLISGNDE